MRSLVKRFDLPADQLNVYCCGWCRKWHVGHTPKQLKRKQLKRNADHL
ncbi:MAG: hypothetical protein JNK38_01140 [Acidobacteria bacterium]|nr:hypothetical protein [Acidobacteriota bacterium]